MCLDEVAGRAVDDLIVPGGQVPHVQVHVAFAEDEVVVEEFVVAPAEVRFDEPFDGGVRPIGDRRSLARVDEEAVVIQAVLCAQEGGVLFGHFRAKLFERPPPQTLQTLFRTRRLAALAVPGLLLPDSG